MFYFYFVFYFILSYIVIIIIVVCHKHTFQQLWMMSKEWYLTQKAKWTLEESCPSKVQLGYSAENNSPASTQWLWLEKYFVPTQFIDRHLEEEIGKANHALNYQHEIFQVKGSIKPNWMNIQLAESGEICHPYISILYKSNKQMRQK